MDNNNLYSMIKIISLYLLIFFIPINTVHAGDEWNKEDLSLASLFTLATIIDWGQTRDIVKNNEDKCKSLADKSVWCDYAYYEKTNIYLGKNPSIGKVDTYMPLAIISTLAIAHFLPKDWRKKFLYGMSFLELGTIYNNNKIGLKVNF